MADWLPEEYKNDASVKDIPDVPTLIKSYKEAQSFIGSSIRVPSENASDADKQAFREKLRSKVPDLVPASDEKAVAKAFGVPEKPEEYTPPADVKLGEPELKAFQERAKSLGLSKKQAEAALKAELQAKQQAEQGVTENKAAIEKEWGAAAKDRVERVATVAEKFGFDKDWIAGVREGRVPLSALNPFFKMVEAIGGEGNNLGKNSNEKTSVATPDEAERQITELTKNPAFMNPKDPAFKHLQAEFLRLTALAAGHSKVPDPYVR